MLLNFHHVDLRPILPATAHGTVGAFLAPHPKMRPPGPGENAGNWMPCWIYVAPGLFPPGPVQQLPGPPPVPCPPFPAELRQDLSKPKKEKKDKHEKVENEAVKNPGGEASGSWMQ